MFFLDRRRRKKIPVSLLVFGWLFLLLPVYNYFGASQRLHVPMNYPEAILLRMSVIEVILLFAAWPVACGFLLGKKWGWWSFLTYGAALIAHNLTAVLYWRAIGGVSALVQTMVLIAIILYVTRPDISAPFFRTYPRGWRLQKRRPVKTSVLVEGKELQTRDISPRGIYITEALANQSPGAPVNVQFVVHGPVVNGAIVRIDDAGTGIAFRGLNSSQKKLISEWVKQVTEQGDASPRNQAAWNSES
ncbi:MAG TPA: PilZ domain-containing protein [Leptospiraceae bacterium]|jgi:hypothetical protein|nr:PilZ domain-containing protein [Leptospirales bacterium]HMU85486.1 PilZ domain-containing protein [Leptospiraceae bacterium]HMX57114.1 PilZ domain-containing protein [Leptospiraceae bacterium]HNJ33566.1 PilZ domain-containing protein [Leptospiraceae bacterium]HNL70349.1 PilZ domain-containing protein [Leptospiraceae bacterium]